MTGVQTCALPIWGSRHRLHLFLTEGVQVLETPGQTPPLGPIEGMASTYEASWTGLFAGLNLLHRPGRRSEVFGAVRLHWLEYRADGDWNLRKDLAHPVSFDHDASGFGFDADIGWRWTIAELFDLSVRMSYRDWSAENGTDTTYFRTGRETDLRLNEVSWRSLCITAAFEYEF